MRIDGITTCVGIACVQQLCVTMPTWLQTLDSITVVSDEPWIATWLWARNLGMDKHCDFHITDAFTRDGHQFDKAIALNEGIAKANQTDWILCFDCDIEPPSNWREIADRYARRDCLNGARRYRPDGTPEDKRFYPRGYFQLWHASDPHYSRDPIYKSNWCAGRYDTWFAEQWPRDKHNELRLNLTHHGEKSRHWCGPNTTPEQMQRAQREARVHA